MNKNDYFHFLRKKVQLIEEMPIDALEDGNKSQGYLAYLGDQEELNKEMKGGGMLWWWQRVKK